MQEKLQEDLNKSSERKQEQQKVIQPGSKFVPDVNNKERNLACQFLDHTLAGRDFLKIDLRELMNLVKIGEGAAAVVFQAQYKFTDVAVKKLKV